MVDRSIMRAEYSRIAEENAKIVEEKLGEYINLTWEIARAASAVIQRCLLLETLDDKREMLLVMLRNCISDICGCLDALERGHDRIIANNLRMVLEDYSAIIHSNADEKTYQLFLLGKHQASSSVSYAKKNRSNDSYFGKLYGELSKISHHQHLHLVARQMVNREGELTHLKKVDPNKLYVQLNHLLLIAYFLRSIGETAEEMCLKDLKATYFFNGDNPLNHSNTIDLVLQKLVEFATPFYSTISGVK